MDARLPFDEPEYLADPYASWDRLREEAPVYWSEPQRFWALTRYDDVVAVLHDPERFSSAAGPSGLRLSPFLPMISHDPPDHDRLRRIASRAFTPARVAEREPRLREIARTLVEALRARARSGAPLDFVEHFASPFPVRVIADILGIPESLHERLRLWNAATSVTGAMSARANDSPRVMEEMHATLAELVEERRAARRDDLVSALLQASESDEAPLRPEELVGLCLLLWIAGNETTTNLISNVAVLLQEEPRLQAELRGGPEALKAFVEEALRFAPPVNGLFREVALDTELCGKQLRKGDRVLMLFAAANRDPRHFPEPARFDPRRKPNDQVGFGHGIHFCLGSHLARLEARIACEWLAELLPAARLDPLRGARIPTGILRGWLRLPMTLDVRG
jgi:hypothetical protein